MSSSICTHFSQNAWKKDLCSNCFKSKDEHKHAAAMAASSKYKSLSTSLATSTSATSLSTKTGGNDSHKTDYPNKHKRPAKSIIKKSATKSKHKSKVSFPKNLSEVIGFGGEWSDDSDDDHDFMNLANDRDDDKALGTDDEESLELKRLTRANTDFNMNNGNLLGDAQENIKKSFAALKLGAPQVDKEGKKQTLQINVIPFGSSGEMKEITKSPVVASQLTASTSTVKAKFETKTTEVKTEKSSLTGAIKKTTTTTSSSSSSLSSTSCLKPSPDSLPSLESDGKNSPPIERAMEKSLLDEISETLEKNQNEKLASESKTSATSSSSTTSTVATNSKIKFEIGTLTESLDNKTFLDLKKPIVRHSPITKDQIKPKVNVFHKYSDSDSNCSDSENGVSAYYDVVETSQTYENLPDGKYEIKEPCKQSSKVEQKEQSSIFSSSQYITDMLLSSKTRAASYNLHEGNFMTSKITPDGLIVTKCSSDDALDSTASSFDGSSDEETSYNMIRSESDSGIGISIGHDYKNINITEKERDRLRVEKKLSASTNNSDYEDIQVTDQKPMLPIKDVKSVLNDKPTFSMEKSRELHGEPDGSADPDGSLENQDCQQLPELPKSPPPSSKIIDARPSFLHGLQKQHPPVLLKKPDLPAKPLVSPLQTPMKTFMSKRPTASTAAATTTTEQHQQQQVISQLQMVMSKSSECLDNDSLKDDAKLKKGKAPNPPMETKTSAPPTPERDYNIDVEFDEQIKKETQTQMQMQTPSLTAPTTLETQVVNLNKNDEDIKYKTEIDNTTSSAASSASTETNSSTASNSSSSSSSTIYTRKIVSNSGTVGKNSAAAIIKEKDKRERATINPKFRSLNTFVTQRSNAIKNLQLQNAVPSLNLKQSMTPEPTPRNPKNLSLSEENLAEASCSKTVTTSMSITNLNAASHNDKKAAAMGKTKTKFSIKKFLRMGTTKTTENLTKQKESIYSEICTGEDVGVAGKPRLVIIHPIDINTTAVEVVKDITKTNETVNAQTVAVVTAKPPAPPLRSLDSQRSHEVNKPARPPPPKSAELRRKQQISLATTNNTGSTSASNTGYVNHNVISSAITASNMKMLTSSPKPTPANNIRIMGEQSGSIKSKSDNVYANLGEIRSSIAPRKPERTASMREREAQLELARKRHMGGTQQQQQYNHQQQQLNKENGDTISICSSNGENVSTEQQHSTNSTTSMTNTTKNLTNLKTTLSPQLSSNSMRLEGKPPTGSRTSTFERKKNEAKPNMSNKLEIFENSPTNNGSNSSSSNEARPSSLKDSVRKINSTIDSYLKDKRDYENMYEFVKSPQSPPPPPARSADVQAGQQRLMQSRRNNLQLDNISVASYTRSEYGPARNFGLNNSLANIPRMTSNSYCGSEMGDLDIYSPYSYYGSETGGDIITGDINDSVWGIPSAIKNRAKTTNRLRMRKGRSVVHKTIEDNYSAVVGANHEALAQVLEQLQQTPVIPPALRPLANAINLRFEDFTILEGAQAFVVGKKAFHAAIWTTAPVTLALSADCNQLAGVGGELNQLSGGVSGALNPITEFCDVVPCYHLPLIPTTEMTLLQATISVLPRLQMDTLQSIGAILKGKSQVLDKSNFNFRGSIPNLNILKDGNGANNMRNGMSVQNLSTLNEESADRAYTGDGEAANSSNGIPAFDDVMTREVAFIMLQLINGMKNLQVKAVEEMPLSLSNVVLSKEYDNKDAQARLCVLQGNNNDEDEPMGTLCKCAHVALTEMLPTTKMTPILADILLQERSESLSKSKSVLEFILWGPSDVALTGSVKERETALQRWLDLERATVLHGLVRTRVELTVYDECHLMFLVRSTAKIMNDAAKIINNYQEQQQQHTNNKQQD